MTTQDNKHTELPAGFVPIPILNPDGFDALTGGFAIKDDDGHLVAGFRVEARHCNHAKICHGGMLATVCDGYLALAAMYRNDFQLAILPTMSLTVDYLAPSELNDWVEIRAEVLRVTRNAVFVQGLARVNGAPVVRASGVFKRGSPKPDGIDAGKALRGFLKAPMSTNA
ncbi:PaaI family thioesterase [Acetobacter sacchari]|nr:PaaI family thioesterase [Acetobacter sacchari]MBO1361272.1 PaaI family thioesterase [Acetobacter sacchari]